MVRKRVVLKLEDVWLGKVFILKDEISPTLGKHSDDPMRIIRVHSNLIAPQLERVNVFGNERYRIITDDETDIGHTDLLRSHVPYPIP